MDHLFGLQHRRDIPPTKAFPRGKDATAPPRRSLHQGTPGHHSPGVACLNGALPHTPEYNNPSAWSVRRESARGSLADLPKTKTPSASL